jgi:hypothetical protein
VSADLTPLYYVTGTAGSIVLVLSSARSYYARQKKRWTDEGAQSTRNTEAIESNTRAATANTAQLAALGEKLAEQSAETRAQFARHETRINRLEDMTEVGLRVRRLRGEPGDN